MRFQPGAALGAELFLLGAEREIHGDNRRRESSQPPLPMSEIVRCQALLPRPARPRIGAVTRKRVVFVTYPKITALDLVGPHEVLGVTGAYELVVAAKEAGPVTTTRGPEIVANKSFASVRGPIDTLIVVGGEGAVNASRDRELVKWVARAAARSRRVASVCTGTFVPRCFCASVFTPPS